jgi:hypothetical protein
VELAKSATRERAEPRETSRKPYFRHIESTINFAHVMKISTNLQALYDERNITDHAWPSARVMVMVVTLGERCRRMPLSIFWYTGLLYALL